MSAPKVALGAALVVAAVVSAAVISNNLLDGYEVADQPGLTVQQRKEKAHVNGEEWKQTASSSFFKLPRWLSSSDSSQMCADTAIVGRVKGLIKDGIPNLLEFGRSLRELDRSRGSDTMAKITAREDDLRVAKIRHEQNPIEKSRFGAEEQARRAKYIAEVEDELKSLRAKLAAEDARIESPPQSLPGAEVILVSEPVPVEFNQGINRVKCRLTFRTAGGGYDALKAITGDPEIPALYSVQPGKDDWIVILLPD